MARETGFKRPTKIRAFILELRPDVEATVRFHTERGQAWLAVEPPLNEQQHNALMDAFPQDIEMIGSSEVRTLVDLTREFYW